MRTKCREKRDSGEEGGPREVDVLVRGEIVDGLVTARLPRDPGLHK